MAEIVRAGIISVDEGQTEAAPALGMTRLQTMRRIVLPQAMRVIIPPTGNETISMLKTTSLVSVIAYPELLYSAQLIYAVNYKTIPLLLDGEHLVPGRDDRAVGRPVLHRAPLRPRGAARARRPTPLLSGSARGLLDPPRGRPHERRRWSGRGRAQALRAPGGAQGHLARGAAAGGDVPARPVGLGQVDVPALHQPPGEDQRRPAVGRRRAGRLPPARATSCTSCATPRSRASARRSAWSSSASTCSRT